MGLGSALLLRMTAEKAIKSLNLEAEVVVADISTARGAGSDADIIVTSAELAQQLGAVQGKIVTVKNYMDANEMADKLRSAISEQA